MKRINAKRLVARRRLEKYGKELRRSIGLPGLLETLSMGKSGAEYRKRSEEFFNYCSRMRFPVQPAVLLDNALCEFSDTKYIDGESVECGEKLKASMCALHPNLMGPNLLHVPQRRRVPERPAWHGR